MNEEFIQMALWHEYSKLFRVTIPNSLALGHEADLISINRNLFVTEYEVKLTLSDFKNDQEKNKWEKFYDRPTGDPPWPGPNHKKTGAVPNTFYYACPKDLIPVDIVPEGLGLIYLSEGWGPNWWQTTVKIVKRAKKLHKEPLDMATLMQIAASLSARYHHIKGGYKRTAE